MIQTGRPARRAGFTFVELLMVIAIIALLAALLLGAITKIVAVQGRMEAASDITQMGQSLEAAKAAYNNIEYLPSRLVLHNDKRTYRDPDKVINPDVLVGPDVSMRELTKRSAAVLRTMFGRRVFQGRKDPTASGYIAAVDELINWDGSGTLSKFTVLGGSQCLVFYLGGMPDRTSTAGNFRVLGFGKDPLDPTVTTGDRIGPFFQFKQSRLVLGPTGPGTPNANTFFAYLDSYGYPFAYFGAYGANDYAPGSVYISDLAKRTPTNVNTDNVDLNGKPFGPGMPSPNLQDAYFDFTTSGSSKKWLFPNKYQIISAGKDQRYGSGGGLNLKDGRSDDVSKDNIVNFSSNDLGNGVE